MREPLGRKSGEPGEAGLEKNSSCSVAKRLWSGRLTGFPGDGRGGSGGCSGVGLRVGCVCVVIADGAERYCLLTILVGIILWRSVPLNRKSICIPYTLL